MLEAMTYLSGFVDSLGERIRIGERNTTIYRDAGEAMINVPVLRETSQYLLRRRIYTYQKRSCLPL